MDFTTAELTELRDCEVELVTLLDEKDRTITDRVVLGETPGHLVEGDPWGSTLLRRIGESAVVRDYLATFAHTEEGARRVLMVALGLASMTKDKGTAGAAALSVAGWCALSLGRWELADALALRALEAADNELAARVRTQVAGMWFALLLEVEADFDAQDVRRCSARVLREITTPRAYLKVG